MRKLALVLGATLLSGCAADSAAPREFLGEELVVGADENAIVRTIDHRSLPPVFASREKGSDSVQIFQKGTNEPYVTVSDWDSDGVFDALSYSVLDSEGNVILEVEDFGMDGQIDMRVGSDGHAELFYEGRWRVVESDGARKAIFVDGIEISLADAVASLGR